MESVTRNLRKSSYNESVLYFLNKIAKHFLGSDLLAILFSISRHISKISTIFLSHCKSEKLALDLTKNLSKYFQMFITLGFIYQQYSMFYKLLQLLPTIP